MSATDWIAVIAIVVSSGALALEIHRWFESGPRLHLSIMADAMKFGGGVTDDDEVRIAVTVINRGNVPTTLTHFIVTRYENIFQKLRKKPTFAGIVGNPAPFPGLPGLPHEVGANQSWTGMVNYKPNLMEARKLGKLYVGIVASHSNMTFYQRVPLPTDVPDKSIEEVSEHDEV